MKSKWQLKDFKICFEPTRKEHIQNIPVKTYLWVDQVVQMIGQIDNIDPRFNKIINFPLENKPITFRMISLDDSDYQLALFRIEDNQQQVFVQRIDFKLKPYISQYLKQFNQLSKQLQKQTRNKDISSTSEVWKVLRNNFTVNNLLSMTQFYKNSVTLNFKFYLVNEYDQMIERAEQIQEFKKEVRETTKQILSKSSTVDPVLIDRILQELAIMGELTTVQDSDFKAKGLRGQLPRQRLHEFHKDFIQKIKKKVNNNQMSAFDDNDALENIPQGMDLKIPPKNNKANSTLSIISKLMPTVASNSTKKKSSLKNQTKIIEEEKPIVSSIKKQSAKESHELKEPKLSLEPQSKSIIEPHQIQINNIHNILRPLRDSVSKQVVYNKNQPDQSIKEKNQISSSIFAPVLLVLVAISLIYLLMHPLSKA